MFVYVLDEICLFHFYITLFQTIRRTSTMILAHCFDAQTTDSGHNKASFFWLSPTSLFSVTTYYLLCIMRYLLTQQTEFRETLS